MAPNDPTTTEMCGCTLNAVKQRLTPDLQVFAALSILGRDTTSAEARLRPGDREQLDALERDLVNGTICAPTSAGLAQPSETPDDVANLSAGAQLDLMFEDCEDAFDPASGITFERHRAQCTCTVGYIDTNFSDEAVRALSVLFTFGDTMGWENSVQPQEQQRVGQFIADLDEGRLCPL